MNGRSWRLFDDTCTDMIVDDFLICNAVHRYLATSFEVRYFGARSLGRNFDFASPLLNHAVEAL